MKFSSPIHSPLSRITFSLLVLSKKVTESNLHCLGASLRPAISEYLHALMAITAPLPLFSWIRPKFPRYPRLVNPVTAGLCDSVTISRISGRESKSKFRQPHLLLAFLFTPLIPDVFMEYIPGSFAHLIRPYSRNIPLHFFSGFHKSASFDTLTQISRKNLQ